MSLSFNQSILVDCSQSKSQSSNSKSWLNTTPEPIILNPQDSIQVYSSFINNKSTADSIEIIGSSDLNKINDQETNLTLGYYKNNTLNGVIPMPYNFFISSLQTNAITMRDGFNNAGNGGSGSLNTFHEWTQDLGQRSKSRTNNKPLDSTFAYCTNTRLKNDKPSRLSSNISRLANLPTGNPQSLDDYTEDTINPFKTYLNAICSEGDGSRHTAFTFNKKEFPNTDNNLESDNKYIQVLKTIKIEIEEGSYSPSNLGSLITNQLGLNSNDGFKKVVDENNDEQGFYIETPTTIIDDALYISREKIKNAESSFVDIVGSDNKKKGVYPSPSPIVLQTSQESATDKNFLYAFNPQQDNYFELGKTDQSKSALSDTSTPTGNGFITTGDRPKAYEWGMLGRSETDTDSFSKPVNVYFKYPKTLESGQNLMELAGLNKDPSKFFDFNADVKLIQDNTLNPDGLRPTIPFNNNQNNNNGNKDGFAFKKGDFGYILTNAKWNSENLLLWKKFFDSQLIEQNIENCYVWDYANTLVFNDAESRYDGNIKSRLQSIRGKNDSIETNSDGQTINTGNRWINIGQVNNINTGEIQNASVDAFPDQSSLGGFRQLTDKFGNVVYNDDDFPLKSFASDFLGNDENTQEDLSGKSINKDFDLMNNFSTTKLPNTTQGSFLIGNPDLDYDTDGYPKTASYMNDNQLNGYYDIDCRHIKYLAHTQLIDVRESYTDRFGNLRNFVFPTEETKEMESVGYGYMYKYIDNDGDAYISFYVNRSSGGIQRNVLQFAKDSDFDNTGIFHFTQSLGWLPFFSSYGNQAIMSVQGQGAGLDNSATLDENNGDILVNKYLTTITQSGVGATGVGAEIVFDDITSRFTIQNFYSPIISSNFYNFDNTGNQKQPENVGNEIVSYNVNNTYFFKINTGYSYFNAQTLSGITPPETSPLSFFMINAFQEIFPYNYRETLGKQKGNSILSFYYSQTGIFIEKWIEKLGAFKEPLRNEAKIIISETEENFNKSLWKKLGFSYSQTHDNAFKKSLSDTLNTFRNSTTINENGGIDNQKYYSMPITNNTDLFNVSFDNLLFENRANFNMFLNNPANSINSLEIISKSTSFLADDLASRSQDPYFIIESNILSVGGVGQNYYSQDAIMSGIDIVEKSFNSNDFYMYSGNVIHEVSKSYEINNIVHQIRRSNGLLLNTNNFSSVIYLIQKRIVVGLTPQQIEEKEELIQQNEILRRKNQKKIDELSKDNLNPKQKLLKEILYKNFINKKKLDIEDNNDDDIEDLFDEEVEEQEEENEDEDLPELEGDDMLNLTEVMRVNPPITLTMDLPFEEEPQLIDDDEIGGIDLEKTKQQILLDTPINRNKPLFDKKGLTNKRLKKIFNLEEPKENINTIFKELKTLPKPEEEKKISFPTFSEINDKPNITRNLGRPKYKSLSEKSLEPITEKQLENLKQRLSQRVRGQKMIQTKQEPQLKNPFSSAEHNIFTKYQNEENEKKNPF
tara:strand:- start:818 stop:5275 length:4458 start_codon:yes stop_codon:yes gene_type:complete